MSVIDMTTDFGRRALDRLGSEQVIWLTTQGKGGKPQPSPVWFLHHQNEVLVLYSRPNTPKLRNIADNPVVAMMFNTSPEGGDVMIFHGDAREDDSVPKAIDSADYLDKYREGITRIGMTPETFSDEYSAAISVQLTSLRGF
jgi:PPOX class probable F420-dependent enzyme